MDIPMLGGAYAQASGKEVLVPTSVRVVGGGRRGHWARWWSIGSDSSVASQGWRVDTITLTQCIPPTPTPVPTDTPTSTPTNTFTPVPTDTPTNTPTNTLTPTPGTNGCPPGYWKNHTANWPAPYTTSTTLGSQFTLPSCGNINSLASDTFLMALDYNGGSNLRDAAKQLLRQAVTALLNAASGIGYPLNQAQIKIEVNTALASCNRATIQAEKERLERFNNSTCPLH